MCFLALIYNLTFGAMQTPRLLHDPPPPYQRIDEHGHTEVHELGDMSAGCGGSEGAGGARGQNADMGGNAGLGRMVSGRTWPAHTAPNTASYEFN